MEHSASPIAWPAHMLASTDDGASGAGEELDLSQFSDAALALAGPPPSVRGLPAEEHSAIAWPAHMLASADEADDLSLAPLFMHGPAWQGCHTPVATLETGDSCDRSSKRSVNDMISWRPDLTTKPLPSGSRASDQPATLDEHLAPAEAELAAAQQHQSQAVLVNIPARHPQKTSFDGARQDLGVVNAHGEDGTALIGYPEGCEESHQSLMEKQYDRHVELALKTLEHVRTANNSRTAVLALINNRNYFLRPLLPPIWLLQ